MIKLHVYHSDNSIGKLKEFETVEECRDFFHGYGGSKNIKSELSFENFFIVRNEHGAIGFSDHKI